MSVMPSEKADVVSTGQSVSISQLFQITASSSDPTYLILNGFDRDEYTGQATGATGTLRGSSAEVSFSVNDGDAREAGIVFQYQSSTGRYYNASVGYLDQLTYVPSTSEGDVTDFSLFGTSNLHLANSYAADTLDLTQIDPSGYLGTVTVATEPYFTGSVPTQATPDSIASIADSFVGQAWNMNGCWVLASTIAAEAGASLPVQSTADIAGQANGEWFIAYNGPAGSSGNWESMVQAGDMVGFVTASGSGHITTCVSGSSGSAMVVDNITYVDGSGNVLNSAGDGSANDVTVEAAHAASQEWAGVQASSVVIYRLDTPVVTASVAMLSLAAGASENLASVLSASDPEGKSIADYQVYLENPSIDLAVNGTLVDTSAANVVTVTSLSQAVLDAAISGGSDDVTVRAFNGSYWGDWTSLALNGAATASQSVASTPTPTASPSTVTNVTTPISSDTISVYRFFDTGDGTHFFTASLAETDTLIASRPDMIYEGISMNAIAAPGTDAAAEAVYRFFDTANGTHFYTASAAERDSLIATQPDMTLEGIAFYEDATPQSGDVAVYRFFDTIHGTHLYTDSTSEFATILATRPDLTPEGIAFYAPKT